VETSEQPKNTRALILAVVLVGLVFVLSYLRDEPRDLGAHTAVGTTTTVPPDPMGRPRE